MPPGPGLLCGARSGVSALSADASLAARADRALADGLAFLARTQLESGEFPVFMSIPADPHAALTPDPAIFPTALIAYSLSFCADAESMQRRAMGFLQRERDAFGLWRHWPRRHPHRIAIPPDLDDTSCASLALKAAGEEAPANGPLLLANRNDEGLFLTWVVPRWGWRGAGHAALAPCFRSGLR